MKIALNIELIQKLDNGIAIYTNNIYNRLKQKNNGRYEFYKYILTPKNKWQRVKKLFWTNIYLPIKLKLRGISVYHNPDNVGLPFIKTCKFIVTIHDIVPYIFPKEYYPSQVNFMKYRTKLLNTVKKADIILTDSIYSKNDLVKYLGVNENKIKVIYLGVDENIKRTSDEEIINTKKKLNIENKYILGIGGNEFRKNGVALVKAFNEAKSQGYLKDHKLVIIGKNVNGAKEISENNDIILTGRVSENELLALYSGADVFVYPSLYEGFGLPPLEAMACGTAVITSNTTSIPEVVGDAAILVDPNETEEIKEAICKVLENASLKAELIEKGKERVKQFKWDKTVEEVEQIYNILG